MNFTHKIKKEMSIMSHFMNHRKLKTTLTPPWLLCFLQSTTETYPLDKINLTGIGIAYPNTWNLVPTFSQHIH